MWQPYAGTVATNKIVRLLFSGGACRLGHLSQVAVLLLIVLLAIPPAFADGRRVALVIGNSEYKHTPRLANPKNDASDIAVVLQGLGFAVMDRRDLDKVAMDRAFREFAEALHGARVGLFFYAGHGLQIGGQNYLVPIDAKLATASSVDFEMVRLDLVHRTMERETKTNILIMDACRDNPLARNLARALGTRSTDIGRGFAPVESGEGTLISFSTQPGNVALDGTGRNSPFAAALLKHVGAPGEDLAAMLINVRNDVMAETGRRQVPWEHSALTARFFFAEPRASADQEVELTLWASVKDSEDPAVVDSYLRKYPQGSFAVVARTLIAALQKQQQMAKMSTQEKLKRDVELRKAEEDVREAQKAVDALSTSKLAALPKGPATAPHPFDGTWTVELSGGPGCAVKSNITKWTISNSMLPDRGHGNGHVTKTGSLVWRIPPSVGSLPISHHASLKGSQGTGGYAVGSCVGTTKFTRQ